MYNSELNKYSSGDVIMELNAYAAGLERTYGKDTVFNYTLGNPSVVPPESVYEAVRDLMNKTDQMAVHGYSPNPGFRNVRQHIAEMINQKYGRELTLEHVYLVPGSCAGLAILCKALTEPGDEFIVIAPYFTEYSAYVDAAGAKLVEVMVDLETFHLDNEAIRRAITPHTKAIIIDSPNNPSGAVYPEENLRCLSRVLREKEAEYGHPIFLISDEPYREIVYGDTEVPYLMNLYGHTIVSYSYSKSLSLAGERIAYLAFSEEIPDLPDLMRAVGGAGRIFGHACAPTLFQLALLKCSDDLVDISQYRENRDLLAGHLKKCGFEFVPPEGAFYILMKSPVDDAVRFAKEIAEKYRVIVVPTDAFGLPGYVRFAYCVSRNMIERSLPALSSIAEEYLKGNRS